MKTYLILKNTPYKIFSFRSAIRQNKPISEARLELLKTVRDGPPPARGYYYTTKNVWLKESEMRLCSVSATDGNTAPFPYFFGFFYELDLAMAMGQTWYLREGMNDGDHINAFHISSNIISTEDRWEICYAHSPIYLLPDEYTAHEVAKYILKLNDTDRTSYLEAVSTRI